MQKHVHAQKSHSFLCTTQLLSLTTVLILQAIITDSGFLGCNAMWFARQVPTLQRNILAPSSMEKSEIIP